MFNSLFYIAFLLLIAVIPSKSQPLPSCNMYQFTVSEVGGQFRLRNPKFLTAFNKEGYNNQPSFINDDLVYFTTNYYEKGQTEIASMDLFERKLRRISYTSESEYSPTAMPENRKFSCVRVEKDGKTQSLSVFPLDGMAYAQGYLPTISNIGYHCWLSDTKVALFLINGDSGNSLAVVDIETEQKQFVTDNVGRCIKTDRNGLLFFIDKLGQDWFLKSYDDKTNRIKLIARMPDEVEDFELLNDGSFLAGKGSLLLKLNPEKDLNWSEVKDLSSFGLKNITRIAKNKKHLIIVDQAM